MSPREVKPLKYILTTTNTQPTPEDWMAAREEYKTLLAELAEAKKFGLEQYNLYHKTRAERDGLLGLLVRWRNTHPCGRDDYKCQICEDTDNVLAGGSGQEARCENCGQAKDVLASLANWECHKESVDTSKA